MKSEDCKKLVCVRYDGGICRGTGDKPEDHPCPMGLESELPEPEPRGETLEDRILAEISERRAMRARGVDPKELY